MINNILFKRSIGFMGEQYYVTINNEQHWFPINSENPKELALKLLSDKNITFKEEDVIFEYDGTL